MGKLISLARALSGEKSLHSALGRWIQAVSMSLDGGAATPDYGFAKKGPALVTIDLNDNLVLELPGLVRGISYVTASGSWILTPGKTYILRAVGWFSGFSIAATGMVDVAWVDENNARLSAGGVDSPTARFRPTTCTDADSTGAALEMVYEVPAGAPALIVAKLRCLNATGTANMTSGSWTSTVQEIPG